MVIVVGIVIDVLFGIVIVVVVVVVVVVEYDGLILSGPTLNPAARIIVVGIDKVKGPIIGGIRGPVVTTIVGNIITK